MQSPIEARQFAFRSALHCCVCFIYRTDMHSANCTLFSPSQDIDIDFFFFRSVGRASRVWYSQETIIGFKLQWFISRCYIVALENCFSPDASKIVHLSL